MEKHICVECHEKKATHWGESLCEECLRKLLTEEKDEQ